MKKFKSSFPANTDTFFWLRMLIQIHFVFLFAFPLFPLRFTNIVLMSLALLTIIHFIAKPVKPLKTLYRNLFFIIPFIPYLIEYVIDFNSSLVRFEFEKKLFFFTAPLFVPFAIHYSGIRNTKIMVYVFALSVFFIGMFSFVRLAFDGLLFHAASYENGAYLLRDSFEKFSRIHPTYFSLFALFSAFAMFFTIKERKKSVRITAYIVAAILLLFVLILAVRIAFVSLCLIFFIVLVKSKHKRVNKIIISFGIMILIGSLLYFVPSLRNRFAEFSGIFENTTSSNSTIAQRKDILKCSIQVFSEHILTGTGCKNYQKALNHCYSSSGHTISDKISYNPHNQFLSMGINYGVVVLLIFLISLYMIFRKVLKFQEGLFFTVLILLFFMSESLLERQMGVYFFGMFSLWFYNSSFTYHADGQLQKE